MKENTQSRYQKNERLEQLLAEITAILQPAEERILGNFQMPKYPVILIMGAGRCGSSLLLQWLAHTRKFAYPTNLLSRFYGAPYIGAKIQQVLTEFDHNAEIYDFNEEIPFISDQGKTRGALAPNEFWYFWRRFFPFAETNYIEQKDLHRINASTFLSELAAIEAVFEKPLAMKGMIANWNIPFLSSIFENVLFVFIKRHPFYNIQSKLRARDTYFGDRSKEDWYSFKPKEYTMLKDLDPIEQVAGQVYFTNCAAEEGISQVKAPRRLEISYEEFCQSPQAVFQRITDKFRAQGYEPNWDYSGPSQFECANQVKLSPLDCQSIISAYKNFSGITISP